MPAVRAKSSNAIAIAPDCEIRDRRPGSAGTAPTVAFSPSDVRTTPKLAGPRMRTLAARALGELMPPSPVNGNIATRRIGEYGGPSQLTAAEIEDIRHGRERCADDREIDRPPDRSERSERGAAQDFAVIRIHSEHIAQQTACGSVIVGYKS